MEAPLLLKFIDSHQSFQITAGVSCSILANTLAYFGNVEVIEKNALLFWTYFHIRVIFESKKGSIQSWAKYYKKNLSEIYEILQ